MTAANNETNGHQDDSTREKAVKDAIKGRDNAFFATENADNPDAQASMELRKSQFAVYKRYAWSDEFLTGFGGVISSADADSEVARMCHSTGFSKREVEAGIYAYLALRHLPMLRKVQEATQRLDISRLKAIERGLNVLGHDVDPELYDVFDSLLIGLFTAGKVNEPLPTPHLISRRLNQLLGDVAAAAACDKAKRKKRESGPPGSCDIHFFEGLDGPDSASMTVNGDATTMASIDACIETLAKDHDLSKGEAAVKLLCGELTANVSATIYGYTPLNPDGTLDESASVYIPGAGWTGAEGTAQFHQLAADDEKGGVFVDMDRASSREVAGYVPPNDIKAYVRGRDGTCVYPGCDVSAVSCQLDHRIPYGEGGRTEAANLFCLCPHHHNTKTDKRAFYLPDPVTGEIVWLFADGTFARVESDGFIESQITPVNPRWGRSLADVERLKAKKSHFFALCHKLVDEYEATGDYTSCIEKLEQLEREFEMDFPFKPTQEG